MSRTPEQIIAEWLSRFVGDDKPVDAYLAPARSVLRWLGDEGWSVGTAGNPEEPND